MELFFKKYVSGKHTYFYLCTMGTKIDYYQAILQRLGYNVETEYQFHPKRKWRFDYAIPNYRVAIEVEGGVWTQGRHIRPNGFLNDMEKYNAATVMGWRILRTTPKDKMKLLPLIKDLIENIKNGN